MDLRPYVESIQHDLAVAAETGGEDARALAERLVGPLEAALRLALQDVLAAASQEITCELAPGSVEVRLRGRNPEFVVTAPPADPAVEDGFATAPDVRPAATHVSPRMSGEADDGTMARINLRMPEHLKARIERAAAGNGLSVNAWLMRAAAAALERPDPDRRPQPQGTQRYTGWAR